MKKGRKIGYARVSTREQNLDLQLDALKAAGCDEIYTDQGISGAAIERNGLTQALEAIGEGDTLEVWKLDRLGRSLGFLASLIAQFGQEGRGFIALKDGIDTNTSGGKLVFHIMAALAEFERDLISERTVAGMSAAKKRGKAHRAASNALALTSGTCQEVDNLPTGNDRRHGEHTRCSPQYFKKGYRQKLRWPINTT